MSYEILENFEKPMLPGDSGATPAFLNGALFKKGKSEFSNSDISISYNFWFF